MRMDHFRGMRIGDYPYCKIFQRILLVSYTFRIYIFIAIETKSQLGTIPDYRHLRAFAPHLP